MDCGLRRATQGPWLLEEGEATDLPEQALAEEVCLLAPSALLSYFLFLPHLHPSGSLSRTQSLFPGISREVSNFAYELSRGVKFCL
jgi:hypothetical protein